MAPRKSSALVPATSSTSRFLTAEHAKYYRKLLEEKITISRTLDQSRMARYQVLPFFASSSLRQVLELVFPFNRDFVYELYANMEVPFSRECLRSRILGRDIELTREDFHSLLGLSMSGSSVHAATTDGGFDWAELNREIRTTPYDAHVGTLDGLTSSARIVQHVLRSSVFPKVGDKTAITPVLSVSTFFILTGKPFDEVDALIRYVENTMTVRLAHVKRKQNLVLGHVLSYLVFSKYGIRSPRACDAAPLFFADASFHILFGKGKGRTSQPAGEGEQHDAEESEHPEAPRPTYRGESSTSQQTSFDMDSLQSYFDTRFDRLEASQTAHFDRIEATQTAMQGELAWIRSHMGASQTPPDEPEED